MNIIEFDGEIFLNYNGLESLGFESYLDELYEELLSENQIFNKGIGHIFINQKVHVLDEPKKFIKLDLEPKSSLFKRSLELRTYLFEKPRTDFFFTGFFRIEDLSRLAAEHRKKGLRLTTSNFCYLNGKNLEKKIDFKLFERDINIDHKDVSYFLKKKNTLIQTKIDNLRNSLYFPLNEILERLRSENYEHKKLTTPKAETIFINGVNVTENINAIESKNTSSDKHRNNPSPKALEVMLAAIVDLIKKDHPTDYPTDEAIIAAAIELHPEGNGKGLSQTKMKQAFAKGRDHLGIKRQIKPKE